jgi:hypothetical protein
MVNHLIGFLDNVYSRHEENDREPFGENLCDFRCCYYYVGSSPHLNICLTHFLD